MNEQPMIIYQIIVIPTVEKVEDEFYYYYGSTKLLLKDRLSLHRSLAKREKDNSKLHKMLRIPGFRAIIVPVESFDSISKLDCKRKEQLLIEAAIKDPYCLNQRHAYKYPKQKGYPNY